MQQHAKWLDFAKEAFKVIKMLHETPDDTPHTRLIVFYAREAAERSLKAFLIYKKVYLLKTHNLSFLMNNCAKIDPEFLKLKKVADNLHTYYGIEYPDSGFYLPDISLAEDAVKQAKIILEFVKDRIGVN